MANFVTTYNLFSLIQGIIQNAKQSLWLVSPFNQVSDIHLDYLKDAGQKGVKIVLTCLGKKIKKEEREKLESIDNLSLWDCSNLHAKLYFNEEVLVVTSLNLYEYSFGNREVGIFVDWEDSLNEDDMEIYSDAINEVKSILASSSCISHTWIEDTKKADPLSDVDFRASVVAELDKIINAVNDSRSKGYCINCGAEIELSTKAPYRPYCLKHYHEWEKEGKKSDKQEDVCHSCGRVQKQLTINDPFCVYCEPE